MSINSTEFGSWFRFDLGNNNNRNAVLDFNYGLESGTTIFDGQDVKTYTVNFQWGHVANPQSNGNAANVQYSSEIALLTPSIATSDVEGWKITASINNGQYAGNDSLRIFSLTQLKGAYAEDNEFWADNADNSNYIWDFYINGDKDTRIQVEEGQWYDISVTVDTEARTADYQINTLDGSPVATGSYTIPEYCSVWAKGINVLLGRYNSVADIDEVKVQVPVDGDYANAPSISLTEINMDLRKYQIYFEEGEELHVKTTEGTDVVEVESPFEYETTTSGTLEAWTVSGSAESEHVAIDVVAETIALPEANIELVSVDAGFGKTVNISVDNTTVPTQPNILLTYKFNDGAESEEVPSGSLVELTEKGVLTVTTKAYGFGETSVTYENNTEFAVDAEIDFQHMDEATLTEKGFSEVDVLVSESMSGENNWTARPEAMRFWWKESAESEADPVSVRPYDVAHGGIRRFVKVQSTLTEEVAHELFAPMYTWWNTILGTNEDGTPVGCANLKVNYGIGLINTGGRDDESSSINFNFLNNTAGVDYPMSANGYAPLGIDGLTDDDFVVWYTIGNYGRNLNPTIIAATEAEATAEFLGSHLGATAVQKGTEKFWLYRIDTALSYVKVLKSTGESGIKNITNDKVVSDHNAPIYNLSGVQVNPNALQKGVYIQQGKKFVVK